MAKKIEAEETDLEVEKDGKVEGPGVEVELDEDDDEEPEQQTAPQPGQRQAKKTNRGNLRKEIDELRLENARKEAEYERRLSEFQQQVIQSTRQPQEPQESPEDRELKQLEVEDRLLIERWNALRNPTTADQEKFREEAKKIEERKFEARLAKRERARAPRPEQVARQAQQNAIAARHADVFSHQKAAGWAIRRYQDAMDDGHPDTPETVDKIMDQARAKWGIGGRRQDPNLGRKLTGLPASGGGRGGAPTSKVHLTEAEKGMADVMFGKSIPDENERYKHYAKTIALAARQEEA